MGIWFDKIASRMNFEIWQILIYKMTTYGNLSDAETNIDGN